MIAAFLLLSFIALMMLGVPIAVSLAASALVSIVWANWDAQWFGLLAAPQNFYSSVAKYPLLALPMFVLVGSIFDRSGVAQRMVTFAVACVGRGPGMLPTVAILVAMVLGGISGSGPANAAAVGGVMIAAMARAGYPAPFSAAIVGAAAATDILIPPSIAFVIYSVLVPGASVPALFAAGMIPGILAGLALIVPAIWLSRHHKPGAAEREMARPAFWASLRQASWGLAAPFLILGGLRPVCRYGDSPQHWLARPAQHFSRGGRNIGCDHADIGRGRRFQLCHQYTGCGRSGCQMGQGGRVRQPGYAGAGVVGAAGDQHVH